MTDPSVPSVPPWPSVLDALLAIEALFVDRRRELDALNVFPVPDGDTGANMLATVHAARGAAVAADPGDEAAAAVDGALRGARGNSGVLFSQVVRGLFTGVSSPLDDGLAERLGRADQLARAAVAQPVEGSMLTAVRAAAEAARALGGASTVEELAAARAAAHAAVTASPTLLEVLARAGVVDAGARGFALALEALHALALGTAPAPPAVHVPPEGPAVIGCDDTGGRYEVMFLLTPDSGIAADAIRDGLAAVGDSVVVVAADPLVSVHVHTDDIGAAVEVGMAHGRPHDVRVEDLRMSTDVAAARVEHPAGQGHDTATTGVVVGVRGAGLAALATSAGAIPLAVDAGGGTGAAALETAIRAASTRHVVVLPGHRDVVSTAVLVAAIMQDGPSVQVVVEADSAAAVVAALAVLDPTAPDARTMARAAGAVSVGQTGGDHDIAPTLDALALRLGGDEPELVLLLVGADASEAEVATATERVEARWPDADLDVIEAGQTDAAFVVGVE